ncbi:Gcn5-related N-acetyltransferase [Mycobacterium tuberculosis]|uniref:Gcn5-related N-acetyltransferase n=1 Tax=Mycobacterium tuberculosis TaxID=1773 RepID=A0A916PG34_MYCTX|nr:Gcn5-related N-acetyltransferase [Mycobacterium tuberculosis]
MTEALRRVWAKDLDARALYELLKLRVEGTPGVRRSSGSAGCALNATPADRATPTGCCARHWPRWATTPVGLMHRPT